MRATGRLLLASLLLLAVACAGARMPTARPLPAGDARAAALFDAFARDAAARRSLRGVAKLSVDGPNGSGSARQILVVERPARLRVEVLGLLDQTLALLVTDGARYRLVRSEDRSVEQGPVHDALLADVAGIALSPALAVRVLLAAPLAPDARPVGAAALSDGGVRLVVEAPESATREEVDFGADAKLRRWARLDGAGAPAVEATWSDWSADGGRDFPRTVEVVDFASDARARLAWSRLELDPALDPALFALPGSAP